MIYFDSVSDFLAMGGHGFFVWLSYLIVVLALLIQYWRAKTAINQSLVTLSQYYRKRSQKASAIDDQKSGSTNDKLTGDERSVTAISDNEKIELR
ncbi:heme exporter protein CcmD [Aliikangiella maris]|uniref:Heme exporter protein D n=2 Tax=Aliikangiella maris TaxID=3162458 RepID=A0ABV2BTW9_9GAMM